MSLLVAVVLSASLVPEPRVEERVLDLRPARIAAGASYVASASVFVWAVVTSLGEGQRTRVAPLQGPETLRIPSTALYLSGAVLAAAAIGLSIWTLFWSREPG